MQGGFGRTPLLSCSIHMNLYGTYVSHTHLIENRTPPLVKKNPPLLGAAYRPEQSALPVSVFVSAPDVEGRDTVLGGVGM